MTAQSVLYDKYTIRSRSWAVNDMCSIRGVGCSWPYRQPGKGGLMNGTMLQGFSWCLPPDGDHWNRLAASAQRFSAEGITSVWLPPAYKGQAGANDVGYGVYDLYDLGEFDQKGTVATKYRHQGRVRARGSCAQGRGGAGAWRHRAQPSHGADGSESVLATECDPANRSELVLRAASHHGVDALHLSGAQGPLFALQVGLASLPWYRLGRGGEALVRVPLRRQALGRGRGPLR